MIMIITQIFLFLVIFSAIHYIDFKLWGTNYTPTIVLGWPFIFLLLLSSTYYKINFAQFKLNDLVIPIWLIGLLSFWFGGLFMKLIFKNVRINFSQLKLGTDFFSIKKNQLRKLILIAFPIILISVYLIFTLLQKFDFNFADENFQEKLKGGLLGHFRVTLLIITVFLLIFYQKKYFQFYQVFIIIITLIISIAYSVKSWIIIPIVAGFIGRLFLLKTKIKFKHILIIIVPFLMFWLTYQIALGMTSSNNEFIFRHMRFYIFAGPIGFSEHLNQGLSIGTNPVYAFTPLINIFYFIFNEQYYNVVSTFWAILPSGESTNIKSFFGTLYIYGGISYVLTSFILGIIVYSYLVTVCFTIKKRIAPFIVANYSFILAILFMGWFECYLIHLIFYEYIIITILLSFLFKIKIYENIYSFRQ